MRQYVPLVLILPLGACAATIPVAGGPRDQCNDSALSQFIGQPATQELGGRMLATSGAHGLRWVAVGMMVTMDYRADRLTVHLGPTNRVTEARCG